MCFRPSILLGTLLKHSLLDDDSLLAKLSLSYLSTINGNVREVLGVVYIYKYTYTYSIFIILPVLVLIFL